MLAYGSGREYNTIFSGLPVKIDYQIYDARTV
jgi:hypothetical protein